MKFSKNIKSCVLFVILMDITIVLGISPISLSYDDTYIWSTYSDSISVSANSASNVASETNLVPNETTTLPTTASPSEEVKELNSLKLESESAILIEQSTGQVLYAHNIHKKLRPASVTKIMSLLLIMEQIDSGALAYTDQVTCSETASSMGGSQIWFEPGETMTVEELLKAICVVSANDRSCCYG